MYKSSLEITKYENISIKFYWILFALQALLVALRPSKSRDLFFLIRFLDPLHDYKKVAKFLLVR